ncbi:hypothetical protein Q31b_03640 [Novipirellula aureliae]|uniref:Type VI secretion system baseplate subunit TssG n=1 Tax=Novipirellula aureliae TaxID=2527966 RepID=A0A5C6E6B1_9BACT|nr:type VI secretion system baseplate subunit TssG [Novipirellula aureliae]TWU45193.1 hypothetical protein Q31b_03640 [Novipirellula aureliae]
MASPIRKKNASVIDRLIKQPHRFSFFQAVRLLLASDGARSLGAKGNEIGTIKNASDEAIRFRSLPALKFPSSEITNVKPCRALVLDHEQVKERDTTSEEAKIEEEAIDQLRTPKPGAPIEMEIAFWGLIGPVGALPNHYTQIVIDRVRHKDVALRDFLDLFSHRQLSLFYRAWEKTFVSVGVERGLRSEDPHADKLREVLLSIVGRGTEHVRDQLEILDDVSIYYGGQFADCPCAESLEQIIADFLGLPTRVLSLYGQWLLLPPSEQSRLGTLGGHSQLGIDTVLGEKTWDASSKFRVRIGLVRYREFLRLMPTGDQLVPICQLIRSYVGCEFSFDCQVVLMASEIPRCQLGGIDESADSDIGANLGWNTWLCSQTPTRDSDDAVFHHDGSPTSFSNSFSRT